MELSIDCFIQSVLQVPQLQKCSDIVILQTHRAKENSLKTGLWYERPHAYTNVILSLTVEVITPIL